MSPWIFGYTANASGFWNSIAVGGLVALLAAARLRSPSRMGASGFALVLGLWTIGSPWTFSFYPDRAAQWDCVAVGICIAVLMAWALTEQRAHDPLMTPAH